MMSGHFATALVANQRLPKSSLVFLLIASALPDFLWMLFHYLGLEVTTPADVFSTSLSNMTVNMLYSHDLLPQIVWVVLVFAVGKILLKDTKVAMMGAVLVFGHFLLDLISGHPHFVFDTDSHEIGLGLYKSNVYLALAIELVFTALMLLYFFKTEKSKGIKRTQKNMISLIGIFAFGIIFLLMIAKYSFAEMLGLPPIELPFNTTVISLVFTYVAMLVGINHFTRQTIS